MRHKLNNLCLFRTTARQVVHYQIVNDGQGLWKSYFLYTNLRACWAWFDRIRMVYKPGRIPVFCRSEEETAISLFPAARIPLYSSPIDLPSVFNSSIFTHPDCASWKATFISELTGLGMTLASLSSDGSAGPLMEVIRVLLRSLLKNTWFNDS